jgi:hypothetical protein
MTQITSEAELQRLHVEGEEFTYNDFSRDALSGVENNVLHVASCRTLNGANLQYDKYFALELTETLIWLVKNRAQNWKRCEARGTQCFEDGHF